MFRLFCYRAVGFRRFLAAGGVGLIFALGVFAASPALHVWLHGHATPAADDDCVVVLFASGVSMPLAAIAFAPPATAWGEIVRLAKSKIFITSPRYLHQPERGPPTVS